jgi:hypothetical protein
MFHVIFYALVYTYTCIQLKSVLTWQVSYKKQEPLTLRKHQGSLLAFSWGPCTSSFLAHLAKGNVSFCHHLASVVCCPSSINFSHFNLLL